MLDNCTRHDAWTKDVKNPAKLCNLTAILTGLLTFEQIMELFFLLGTAEEI